MRFSHFDLNLLRVLDMLLTVRSVTGAAENLHVTQQAVSGSLRRLREHFNDPLLVRVGRAVELTPLALGLTVPVRQALLTIEGALDYTPSFDPKTAKRTFRIAISDYGSFVIMPRLLKLLAKEAPDIAFQVGSLQEQSFIALEHGDLDFVAAPYPVDLFGLYRPGDSIHHERLFSDDFVCVVDADHPEIKDRLSEEQYRRLSHAFVHFGSHVETLVERGWKTHKLQPRIGVLAPGFASVLFMLPGTASIATVQRLLAEALAASLGLRIHASPLQFAPVDENLFWHQRSNQDPAHAYLREAFRAVTGEELSRHQSTPKLSQATVMSRTNTDDFPLSR